MEIIWNISIYRHKESGYILACLYHGAIFGCGQGSLKLSQFFVPLLYEGHFAAIFRLCEIQNCLFMKAPIGQCYSVVIDKLFLTAVF